MKIYTKGGDKGKTSLLSGTRVAKYHYKVEAYGDVDELSSCIGLLRGGDISTDTNKELMFIQEKLFDLMALLACDNKKYLDKLKPIETKTIEKIEKSIDDMTAKLPPLKYFVLPGGQTEVGNAHLCRAVCRRTERKISKVADMENIDNNVLIFINRLSDYFFVLSRKIADDKNFEQTPIIT